MKKNVMYKVVNGWIKWRGQKKTTGDEFMAVNPDSAEQVMLDRQCEPVTVASLQVKTQPVELKPKAEEPKVEEPKAEPKEKPKAVKAQEKKPSVRKQGAGKNTKTSEGD